MKQKDAEKNKPANTSHNYSKGRRKLDFEKKTKQLPLSGKVIYLDVKDVRQAKNLEGKVKHLGGIVEKFLIKDVNYVISSNAQSSGQKKVDKGQGRADSPTYQSTPSPFNMGQSPSPGAVECKKETVTRGKAILQIAKNKSSLTNVIDTAEKMGIKIVALDAAVKWIDKEMLKLKPAAVASGSKQAPKKKSGLKVQKLKTPYVKFEAVNCHYRPLMLQLDTWPHVNVDTLSGTCPFDGRALGRPQNSERGDREEGLGAGNILSPGTPQAQRDELSGTPQAKSQSKTTKMEENSTCKLFGVPIITAGEIKRERDKRKREAKRKGYCECCKEKYDDVDKHLRGQQHKTFVRNKKNFDALDRLINKGPNTVIFLQSILFRHCVQQAANRSSSQPPSEDDVVLIEDTANRSPDSGKPDLPPEQLRVGRKINRRHRPDGKQDQQRRLVVELERTNLNENMDKDRFKSSLQSRDKEKQLGYSSPSKLRSVSCPHVDRDKTQSTAAVVIRRSGSRGVYGSPRRSHSSSVQSEKTLVIRDSPIASLQPLGDYVRKHSTQSELNQRGIDTSRSGRLDSDLKKRKSDPSSSQSPRKTKRLKVSTDIQADVTVHSQEVSDKNQLIEQNTTHNTKRSCERNSHVSGHVLDRKTRTSLRNSVNATDIQAHLSPHKHLVQDAAGEHCDIPSPRKSLRLSLQEERKVSSDNQTRSSPEGKDEGKNPVKSEELSSNRLRCKSVVDHEVQSLNANNNEIKSVSDMQDSGIITTDVNGEKTEKLTKPDYKDEKCFGSPKSRSRRKHGRHSDINSNSEDLQTAGKQSKQSEDSKIEEPGVITSASLKLRSSPRKLAKMNRVQGTEESDSVISSSQQSADKDKHEGIDKVKPVTTGKRRKWKKKVIQSSPVEKKGKKLSKLKLDESMCSDVSVVLDVSPQRQTQKGKKLSKLKLDESLSSDVWVVSEISPQKAIGDVTSNKHCFKMIDSSSPTFKKHGRKDDKQDTNCDRTVSEPYTPVSKSPVFKRRSRQNFTDCQENLIRVAAKEHQQSLNGQGIQGKEILENTPNQRKTPKNEDSEFETPKRGYSSTPRRCTPRLSRRSLQSELLDQTLQDDELDLNLQKVESEESPMRSTRSRSGAQKNNLYSTPVKSKSKKVMKSNVPMEEDSDLVQFSSQELSPKKSSGRGRSVSINERVQPTHIKKHNISPETENSESPTIDRKSPRKTPVKNTNQLKLRPCSVNLKADNLDIHCLKDGLAKRKWRSYKSGSKSAIKTVKLNRSWLLLSERSMSRLLESEGDQEPFLGFNNTDSDTQLPSDLTYEEVSEVDMSEDSTREWIIEQPGHEDEDQDLDELDETLIEETSLVQQFLPSPDKASNSSWGDACDSFLQSACQKRLQGQICSTPLLLSSNKNRTPIKKQRPKSLLSPQKRIKENDDSGLASTSTTTDLNNTPKNKRTSKNMDELLVDQEIVFNFNYRSPKRRVRGGQKLFSDSEQSAEDKSNSDGKGGKPLRLLKKASDIKKTFKMSYVTKQVKSPKPRQQHDIECGQTVVIVSPKSRHKQL